jgi:hypothetical protein
MQIKEKRFVQTRYNFFRKSINFGGEGKTNQNLLLTAGGLAQWPKSGNNNSIIGRKPINQYQLRANLRECISNISIIQSRQYSARTSGDKGHGVKPHVV